MAYKQLRPYPSCQSLFKRYHYYLNSISILKPLYLDFSEIEFIMKNFLSTLFLTAAATGVLAVPLSPNALDSRSLAAKTAYTVDAYGKEIAAADAAEVLGSKKS
jgi:hypothetical protein